MGYFDYLGLALPPWDSYIALDHPGNGSLFYCTGPSAGTSAMRFTSAFSPVSKLLLSYYSIPTPSKEYLFSVQCSTHSPATPRPLSKIGHQKSANRPVVRVFLRELMPCYYPLHTCRSILRRPSRRNKLHPDLKRALLDPGNKGRLRGCWPFRLGSRIRPRGWSAASFDIAMRFDPTYFTASVLSLVNLVFLC